jgi:hypothetical protein
MNRPTGITIIGVLAIIGGVLGICGGGILLTGGALLAGSSAATGSTQAASLSGVVLFYAVLALILGVLDIVLGVGFLQVKPWAWTLGIVLEIASIVVAVLNIVATQSYFGGVISIAIAGYILYYLNTSTVKQAFGRA